MSSVAAVARAQTGFVQLLRRFPLVSYFVMAYAISWFYVIVFEIIWPVPDTIVTDVPVLFGPVVAGFVMTAVVAGRAGVRQLLRRLVLWRVSPVWYLFATVAVPALYVLGLALVPGAFSSVSLPLSTLLLLPVFFVVLLVTGGPMLEEPGWRGFALPACSGVGARWSERSSWAFSGPAGTRHSTSRLYLRRRTADSPSRAWPCS